VLALTRQQEGIVAPDPREARADPRAVAAAAEGRLRRSPRSRVSPNRRFARLADVFSRRERRPRNSRTKFVSNGALASSRWLRGQGRGGELLKKSAPKPENILHALREVRGSSRVTDQTHEDKFPGARKVRKGSSPTSPRRGKLDPVIEAATRRIRRSIQILGRPHEEQPGPDR
jgi:ATP-dependent Clp protease ATP-binding subunit ClpB